MTSPSGTLRLLSSCGGPQTPTGKAPYARGATVNGNTCVAAVELPVQRHGRGQRRRAHRCHTEDAARGVVGRPAGRRGRAAPAGTVEVRMRPNSQTTTNGLSGVPSAVGSPAPDGCTPYVVTTLSTTAPSEVGSRYFSTKAIAREQLLAGLVARAELDGDADRPDLEAGLAVEVRSLDLDAGAEVHADGDLAEQPEVDRDAGVDAGVGHHLVAERVEVDDPVRRRSRPSPRPARARRRPRSRRRP